MKEEIIKAIGLAMPTIIGVVIGFVLSGVQQWFERQRKLRAHWAAIRAEMTLCERLANNLLSDKVQSPLYRFPIAAMQVAFPILLAEGHVNEHEVLVLSRYSSQIQDLNRGLDYAATCLTTENNHVLDLQYDRNLLKTRHLLGMEGNENVIEAAKQIVGGKLLAWREFL